MPIDYIILLVVAMIGTGFGLLLLREAKKYRARRNNKSVNKKGIG